MWGKWFLLGPEKYEKTEHSKFKSFLFISWEAEILATAKTQNMGIVNLLSTGKLWENTNILKVWVLLHIPHSFISCVIETHKIPWEIWILIVRDPQFEMFVLSQTFLLPWEFTFPIFWELDGFPLNPKYLRNPCLFFCNTFSVFFFFF